MKIFTQDRHKVIEMPREMWVVPYDGGYGVLGTSYITPLFGVYVSDWRAKEVLKELFDYCRNGKSIYIMPEE